LNQKLQSQYNVLSEDVKQTKEVVMKLQSFIMDISQKLNSFITTQESINEEFFDLRDDFHNSIINEVTNIIPENDETSDDKNNAIEDEVVNTIENQENDLTVDNEMSDNQYLDRLIVNNLDNFLENTTNVVMEEVTTATTATATEISKNKQRNNKNKSMNVNV
jgi:hypothetical protein